MIVPFQTVTLFPAPQQPQLQYYTPQYWGGVDVARNPYNPNQFSAPAVLGPVNAVGGFTNVDVNPVLWEQFYNRAVHYDALGNPVLLECQAGRPTAVPRELATDLQPVLRADADYYQCQ